MATWSDMEMYGYTMKDLGLKTCPFNPKHKIKASQYSKHVLKCEQQFPKSITTSNLNSSRNLSIDSFFESRTDGSDINDLTNSMNQLNACDDWFAEEPQRPGPSIAGSSGRSPSSDSAIGLTSDSNSNESTQIVVEVYAPDQTSGITQSDLQTNGNSQQTERSVDRSADPQVVPIVPQQVTALQEPTNENKGSGDNEDTEWNSGQNYSLYEGFENFDDLTDEQIMEMADSFIDVVVLSKMTKTQRKQLNNKLIKLRKAEKELKKKAFNELISFKDVWDPQLNDIPQEIRKPRIDIRDLFNLNKKQNKRIDTLMSTTPISPEPKECPPNPWSPNRGSAKDLKLNGGGAEPSACCSNSLSREVSEEWALKTVCNSCWHSLALNEQNIKRMTVFCAKCSAVKFGGYFECHSCQMYGYFANSQISQHLSKHFPETN